MVEISDKEYQRLLNRDAFWEDSSDLCYEISPGGKINDCNKRVLEVLGFKREELIGKPLVPTIYSPASQIKAESLFEKWKKTGKLRTEELEIKTKKGEIVDVELNADAVRDKQGNIIHSVSVQRIITARKRAEGELKKTKQMLENVTQGITEGILLLSKDFKILWANKAILDQTGYKTEKIVGNYCYKVTHHRESPCELPYDICPIHEVLKTGKSLIVTHLHFDKQGHKFFTEVSAYPIRNEKGEIVQFVHICRDITERKRAEEELKEKLHELEVFHKVSVDRELKMTELKEEIKRLKGSK